MTNPKASNTNADTNSHPASVNIVIVNVTQDVLSILPTTPVSIMSLANIHTARATRASNLDSDYAKDRFEDDYNLYR